MKKYFMMAFVSLFAVAALSSCDKDKDENNDDNGGTNTVIVNNTITATVENGSSYSARIDTVKARLSYSGGKATYIVAKAAYRNGEFTLTLPATVSDAYLDGLGNDTPDGLTVSNPDAKVGYAYIHAYKSGREIGDFNYGTQDWEGALCYANTDLTVKGSYTINDYDKVKTVTVNLALKRGWNMVYEKDVNTTDEIITTTAPAGAKWYVSHMFSDDDSQGSVQF